MARYVRPAFDRLVDLLPAAEVEVADAKVCPVGKRQRVAQRGEQRLVDIVEDAGHGIPVLSLLAAPLAMICPMARCAGIVMGPTSE